MVLAESLNSIIESCRELSMYPIHLSLNDRKFPLGGAGLLWVVFEGQPFDIAPPWFGICSKDHAMGIVGRT